MIKIKPNLQNISLLIGILSGLGILFFLILNYFEAKDFREKEFDLKLISNYSRLNVVDLQKGRVHVFKSQFNSDYILNITGITFYLKLKNVSEQITKILCIGTVDSMGTFPILHQNVFKDNMIIETSFSNEYLQNTIFPNDSITIKVYVNVRTRKEDVSNIHFQILYENDLGGIYETYFVQKINYYPADKPVPMEIDKKNKKINYKLPTLYTFSSKIIQFYTFNSQEINAVKKFMKLLKDRKIFKDSYKKF